MNRRTVIDALTPPAGYLREGIIITVMLVLLPLAVYWQVSGFAFLNYDDAMYLTENAVVQQGLSLETIIWAFTDATAISNYWHPLTWLSHLLDFQLFGANAGGHHLASLLLHIASGLVLFAFLWVATGSFWASCLTAGLFALHPLHVESVAWVAERKDVLSTFFWFLALYAYAGYTSRPGPWRYAAVFLLFVLGLMAKPMVLTLPFTLLLLDYWPLNRLRLPTGKQAGIDSFWQQARPLLLEKIPFFCLTLATAIATYITQEQGGALSSLANHPLSWRLANAITSYALYLKKMFWPADLAAFYPYPGMPAAMPLLLSFLLLAVMTYAAVRLVKKLPFLAVGWFWYLGTLVPVIGLVQIGEFAMADRYTYVPLTGIFLALAWLIQAGLTGLPRRNSLLAGLTVILLPLLALISWNQTRYWADSITLFEHTVAVTADNPFAQHNLGLGLVKAGRVEQGLAHLNLAVSLRPDFTTAHLNLANTLARIGRNAEALHHYREVLRLDPGYIDGYNKIGVIQSSQGDLVAAIHSFVQALELDPDNDNALAGALKVLRVSGSAPLSTHRQTIPAMIVGDLEKIGNILERRARNEQAIALYTEALRLDPENAPLHNNLAIILMRAGKPMAAIEHFQLAADLQPADERFRHNLQQVMTGNPASAQPEPLP